MDNNAIDSFTAAAGLVGGSGSLDTQTEVGFIRRSLVLDPGAHILDLPCGNGRHARLLGEHGFRVTAVDADAASLVIAAREHAHPNVTHTQLDARSIPQMGMAFDAVVSLFSCIGYFETAEDDTAALTAMTAVLRPGGGFVLSTANGPVVARGGSSTVVFEPSGFRIERRDTCDAERSLLEREFVIVDKRSGEETRVCHRRRLYSCVEMTEQFVRAGLSNIRYAGDYSGGPFVPDQSPHVIYVGYRER